MNGKAGFGNVGAINFANTFFGIDATGSFAQTGGSQMMLNMSQTYTPSAGAGTEFVRGFRTNQTINAGDGTNISQVRGFTTNIFNNSTGRVNFLHAFFGYAENHGTVGNRNGWFTLEANNYGTLDDVDTRTASFRLFNYAGATQPEHYGLVSQVYNSGTFQSSATGHFAELFNEPGGVIVSSMMGLRSNIVNEASAGNIEGLSIGIDNRSGATTGSIYGGKITTDNSGTATNIYGLQLTDISDTLVSGTHYGLYVDNVDWGSVNNYGIYVEGGGAGSGNNAALWVESGLSRFAAATTDHASIRLADSSGVDPSSPVDGDLWWNGTALNFQHGGTTTNLLAGGGGGGTPGGLSGQVQFNNAGAFGGSSEFFWSNGSGGRLALGTSTPMNTKLTIECDTDCGTSVGLQMRDLNQNGALFSTYDVTADTAWAWGQNAAEEALTFMSGQRVGNSGTPTVRLGYQPFAVGSESDPGYNALLNLRGSNADHASINFASGEDPNSVNTGDLWWNGTNLYFYNGSTNIDLLAGGGGGSAFVQNGNAFGTDAILGTTDSNGLSLITNNTEAVFIDSLGDTFIHNKLALYDASIESDSILRLENTARPQTSGDLYPLHITALNESSGGNTYGIRSVVDTGFSNDPGVLRALRGEINVNTSGTTTSAYGLSSVVTLDGGGTVTSGGAGNITVTNNNTTMTNFNSLFVNGTNTGVVNSSLRGVNSIVTNGPGGLAASMLGGFTRTDNQSDVGGDMAGFYNIVDNTGTVGSSLFNNYNYMLNHANVGSDLILNYNVMFNEGTAANAIGSRYQFTTTANVTDTAYGILMDVPAFGDNNNFGLYIGDAGNRGSGNNAALWIDSELSRFAPATTGHASIRIAESSTDPSSPESGDLWWNGTNLYFNDGTSSVDLLAGGGGGGNSFVDGGNSFGFDPILGTLDDQSLIFITNNTEWMRITNGGFIGINTNTPDTILDVSGQARIYDGQEGTMQGYETLHVTGTDQPVILIEDNGNGVGYIAQNGSDTIFASENDLVLKYGVDFNTGPSVTGYDRFRLD